MYKLLVLLILTGSWIPVNAQNKPDVLKIKIIDEQNKPIFGVYIGLLREAALLTVSNMDGECTINRQLLQNTDTLQFQGIGYASRKIEVNILHKNPVVRLQELKYELAEAQVQGIPTDHLLKLISDKLKKQKASGIPLCRYYSPAQYEKLTQCRDTIVEYRQEYGLYFTSGNIIPYTIWDKTFRSYMIPKYIARSYNLSLNAQDTVIPLFMTSDNSRFDTGTRKIFTLTRAIQLYGPLFSPQKFYEIHLIDSDTADYIFSFQTRPQAYPQKTRISCKGTFTIDRNNLCLKKMDFDYIDYQLLRQILLSNQYNTTSPFSTKASLTFATDKDEQHYIRSCYQNTTWKYDLGEQFILIEQPSCDLPGLNKLIEKEAFYCYDYKMIGKDLQTSKLLPKLHLAHRYPNGSYHPEVFHHLPHLLDIQKAREDLGRYMNLEDQFYVHSNKPYYPENYLLDSDIDFREKANYIKNLTETRKQLFELFECPLPSTAL